MDGVRHLALSCCLLCALAGVVRIFWPENGSKPVINTVLMLYILASVIPMVAQTDWPALALELRGWAGKDWAAPQAQSYAAYADDLARQASAAALQRELAARGVQATVTLEDGACTVLLAPGSDRAAAEAVLQAACGELPYTVQEGGAVP